MKHAGMLEYWARSEALALYWVKNRNSYFFKFKLRRNPIKTNPFIHYSITTSLLCSKY
jgi:hypothetical protein